MVKIAIVGGDDLPSDDPRQLCTVLAAQGHEAVACLRRGGAAPAPGSPDADRTVPIHVGPRSVASAPDLLPYVGEWAAALERMWSSDRPDVVHAYGWLGGLSAQLAARRHRIPTVQTFMGLASTWRPRGADGAPQDSERRRVEPMLARSATWVTGECTTDVDALAQMRRSRRRVSTLTGGVDVDRYTPVGPAAARTAQHRVLCLVPNLLWDNGLDIAIRALPKVPATELVIAETDHADPGHAGPGHLDPGHLDPGHDEVRAGLGRLAADLGVADRVRFAGCVADADLPMVVRSADVVACTPRRPPRAASALRAMAAGVAVVALPVGVLCDAVVDNVTGLLLSNGSPAALGSALRSLLGQSFRCESMGAAGRSRALSRFSWERVALDALNIYRELGSQNLDGERAAVGGDAVTGYRGRVALWEGRP